MTKAGFLRHRVDSSQAFHLHAYGTLLRSREPGPPEPQQRSRGSSARPPAPPPSAQGRRGFPSGVTAAPPPAGFASGSARGRSWRRRRGERGAHGAAAVRRPRPGPAAGAGRRPEEMDKLTVISGCLFLAADIFAIASLANPDWINTGESAGEEAGAAGGLRCCGAAGRGRRLPRASSSEPGSTFSKTGRGAPRAALMLSVGAAGRRLLLRAAGARGGPVLRVSGAGCAPSIRGTEPEASVLCASRVL